MIRAGVLVCTAAFTAGLVLGCAERRIGADEPEDQEMPTCATVNALGYWADGGHGHIVNEDGVTQTVCMCLTRDEAVELSLGEPELFIEHEINDLALAKCEQASERIGFDWDACQSNYETAGWRPGLAFAIDDYEYLNQQGLVCDGSELDGELACALGERRPSGAALLILAALFGLRRRDGRRPSD